jgi:hypothetical protein
LIPPPVVAGFPNTKSKKGPRDSLSFFLPLPLTLKISVFRKTGNYGRGNKAKITEKSKLFIFTSKLK